MQSLTFSQRHGNIDWQAIKDLNLNSVLESRGIESVKNTLHSLTFAELCRQDLVKFNDQDMIKLFKLGQLALEYKMNIQQFYNTKSEKKKAQYEGIQKQVFTIQQQIRKNQKEIEALKLDAKSKLKNLHKIDQNIISKREILKAKVFRKEGLKCRRCGKCFINTRFLQKHFYSRHSNLIKRSLPESQLVDYLQNNIQVQFEKQFNKLEIVQSRMMEEIRSSIQIEIDQLRQKQRQEIESVDNYQEKGELKLSDLQSSQYDNFKSLSDSEEVIKVKTPPRYSEYDQFERSSTPMYDGYQLANQQTELQWIMANNQLLDQDGYFDRPMAPQLNSVSEPCFSDDSDKEYFPDNYKAIDDEEPVFIKSEPKKKRDEPVTQFQFKLYENFDFDEGKYV